MALGIDVEQAGDVRRAADRRQLKILGIEIIAGEVEADAVVEEGGLDPRFIRHRLFLIGGRNHAREGEAALHRRRAIAARDAGVEGDRIRRFIGRAGVPGQQLAFDGGRLRRNRRVRVDDEIGARFDRPRSDEVARVVVVARAGLERQPALERIVDRSEDAVGFAVLPLHRDRRGDRVGRAAEFEAGDVEAFVEIEGAELVTEPAAVVRGDADFLRELVEAGHIVLALRLEGDEPRTRDGQEHRAEAAIDVAAALEIAVPVGGDRISGHRAEIIFEVERGIIGVELLEIDPVLPHLVALEFGAGAAEADELVAAGKLRIGAEDDRRAVIDADLPGHAAGEGAAFILQLKPRGDVVIAAEILGLGRRDIVDPIVAMLIEAREAHRKAVVVGGARRDFDLAGAITAIAGARIAAGLAGLDGVELDDARRRVAAEERALRPAQHLDAVEVEDREALEDRVFEDDFVIDEADRLRGVEVEVGVAEAADIEARERTAVRAFDVEAGDAARERADVGARRGDRIQRIARQHADRDRHVLQAFLAALRGDDDVAKAAALFGGGNDRSLLRGGGGGRGGGEGEAHGKGGRKMAHDLSFESEAGG